MTEQERDGGLKADGETAAELRGGNWQQAAEGHMAAELRRAGKAEGCKQHRGDSAGGLRGKKEPKGRWLEFSGGAERSGTERRRRPSGRG
jgi:hypothetical protein